MPTCISNDSIICADHGGFLFPPEGQLLAGGGGGSLRNNRGGSGSGNNGNGNGNSLKEDPYLGVDKK